jgi:hypothetical protein
MGGTGSEKVERGKEKKIIESTVGCIDYRRLFTVYLLHPSPRLSAATHLSFYCNLLLLLLLLLRSATTAYKRKPLREKNRYIFLMKALSLLEVPLYIYSHTVLDAMQRREPKHRERAYVF